MLFMRRKKQYKISPMPGCTGEKYILLDATFRAITRVRGLSERIFLGAKTGNPLFVSVTGL